MVPMTRRLPRPVQHSLDRFTANPSSMLNAVMVLVVITVFVVLAGSAVVWLLDRRDFADFGSAVWFTLQTVTTVGYGDSVPTSTVGRVVGGIVMIVGVALISIVTATITTAFVDSAHRRRQHAADSAAREAALALGAQLDEVLARLATLEHVLATTDRDPARVERPVGDDGGGVS
jgi:voltage-gated potassium channel